MIVSEPKSTGMKKHSSAVETTITVNPSNSVLQMELLCAAPGTKLIAQDGKAGATERVRQFGGRVPAGNSAVRFSNAANVNAADVNAADLSAADVAVSAAGGADVGIGQGAMSRSDAPP